MLCGSPREARRKETDTVLIEVSHSTRFDMPKARKQIIKYNSNCSVPPPEQLNSYPLKVIMRILLKHHQWVANDTSWPFSLQESVNAAVHSPAFGPTAQYMDHHWDVGKA